MKNVYQGKKSINLGGNDFEVAQRNLTANIDIAFNEHCNFAGLHICKGVCPKAYSNEAGDDTYMQMPVLVKLLGELQELGYKGSMSLNRYNEPLYMKFEEFVKRVKLVHELLPESSISINTNGSLLTKEKLDVLHANGLNVMNLQIYPMREKDRQEFSFEFAQKALEAYEKKLEVTTELAERLEGFFYSWKVTSYKPIDGRPVQFMIYAKNLRAYGVNRGGTVSAGDIEGENYTRTTPCSQIGRFMAIDADGSCFMCTNLLKPHHNKYCLGNIADMTIWEIYGVAREYISAMTNEFPKGLSLCGDICTKCKFMPNVAQIEAFKKAQQI